jgi:AraC-like DNA-binding protein
LSRLAYHRLKRDGIDPAPLLSSSGLTSTDIGDPSSRIRIRSQIDFLALAAKELKDPLLGFHLCEDMDLRQGGWLYYVAASASTFGAALLRLERYSQIGNEGVRLKVTNDDEITVRIDYFGLTRRSDHQQIGSLIGLLASLSRYLTRGAAEPTLVRIAHKLGNKKHEVERLLGCKVRDGSGSDVVCFPAKSWGLETVGCDPYLQQLCVNACEEALSKARKMPRGLKSAVEKLIAELLPHQELSEEAVAERLRMSPRTLIRRLASEECSFSRIVKEVRVLLARQYLSSGLSVSETAWLVGYSEVSAFTRAFRRWTGASPRTAVAHSLKGRAQRRQKADAEDQDSSSRSE